MSTNLIIILLIVVFTLISIEELKKTKRTKRRVSISISDPQIKNTEDINCAEQFSELVKIAQKEVKLEMQRNMLRFSTEERRFFESMSREEKNFYKVIKYGELIIDDVQTMIDFAKVSYELQYFSRKPMNLTEKTRCIYMGNKIFSALQCIIKSQKDLPISSCPQFIQLIKYRDMLGCQRMNVFYEGEIINPKDKCLETTCYIGMKSCYEIMLMHLRKFERCQVK